MWRKPLGLSYWLCCCVAVEMIFPCDASGLWRSRRPCAERVSEAAVRATRRGEIAKQSRVEESSAASAKRSPKVGRHQTPSGFARHMCSRVHTPRRRICRHARRSHAFFVAVHEAAHQDVCLADSTHWTSFAQLSRALVGSLKLKALST